MTPEELREKVARAIGSSLLDGALHFDWRVHLEEADAALSVVREALREPTPEMLEAVGRRDDQAFAWGNAHGATFEELWAVALAASALREGGA